MRKTKKDYDTPGLFKITPTNYGENIEPTPDAVDKKKPDVCGGGADTPDSIRTIGSSGGREETSTE